MPDRPNILFVIADQERQRDWLPDSVSLPARARLMAEGMEFRNYWTHSSPCSPSRATLMTGQYVPQHGVVDNVIHPHHTPLDPAIPTIGRLLRDHAGYQSSYIGKWHLGYGPHPDMEAHVITSIRSSRPTRLGGCASARRRRVPPSGPGS